MAKLSHKKFVLGLALLVGILSIAPFLYGLAHTPPGSRYLGFQYNTDDEMVYAAWMRQAMNGHFLMDNRFAIDPQPRLTINLYFFVLGLVAKVVGIPWASALARFLFGAVFVLLLDRLIRMVSQNETYQRLALVVGCFGAGFGFVAWQTLGQDFVDASHSAFKGVLLGHLPNDIWQPEGFAFSSILTNSLFSFSLCLILGIFICVLKARTSWKTVPLGVIGMLVLMNVHSYDVLILTLVLIGLLVAMVVKKEVTAQWLLRVICIGLGALPSALWFEYVLKHDPVFGARAATETYTENFRSILGGYGLLMLFAGFGGIVWIRKHPKEKLAAVGIGLFGATVIGLFFLAHSHTAKYWMGLAPWCGLYLLSLVILALAARPNPAISLILSWAVIGLIAPYFPGLFERKLLMGLSIPWAILGAAGMCFLTRALKENERKLVLGLCVILSAATSVRWLGREFELINKNMSNTTLQPAYLSPDITRIVDYLNAHVDDKRVVVIAIPGIPVPIEGDYISPLVPDLNPVLSGFTGVYTYAGHWSETPHYDETTDIAARQSGLPNYLLNRRGIAASFFFKWTLEERRDFIKKIGADYIVTAVPEDIAKITAKWTPPIPPIIDERDLGQTVVDGSTFRLIKVNP